MQTEVPMSDGDLQQCRQVVAALSESVRILTEALAKAKGEAAQARAEASRAKQLAEARVAESADRDLAIALLLKRVEVLERMSRLSHPERLRVIGEKPVSVN
jgi:regulator of protease activity HflC (stomatin/prohibitin superfamily)